MAGSGQPLAFPGLWALTFGNGDASGWLLTCSGGSASDRHASADRSRESYCPAALLATSFSATILIAALALVPTPISISSRTKIFETHWNKWRS
jgi:hypothetical protein